jgi:hypothetical protein
MNTELSRLIACGCDDASVAPSADDQWLSTQRRIVALLDGCVKRIHVDMQNFSVFCRRQS